MRTDKTFILLFALLIALGGCNFDRKCLYLVTVRGVLELGNDRYKQYIVKCDCDNFPESKIKKRWQSKLLTEYDKYDPATYNDPELKESLKYTKIETKKKLDRKEYDKARLKKIEILNY